MIDPFTTSPNVTVGVATDSVSDPIYLRPGEMIVFPAAVDQVYITNPLLRQYNIGGNYTPAVPWLGQVGILAGGASDLVAYKSRANRTRPSIVASLLAAGTLMGPIPTIALAPSSISIPCNGLEKFRVKILCLDATGAITDPPADLAGTLKLYHRTRLPVDAALVPLIESLAGVIDPDTGYANTPQGRSAFFTNSTLDATIAQGKTAFDFEVGAASDSYLIVTGLLGTGVASLYGIVEGG